MVTMVKIFTRSMHTALRNRNVRRSQFLILGVIVISTVLLSLNMVGKTYRYSIGDIAREDIRVPGDIIYRIESETMMERKRVSETVPLVFDRDQSILVERMKMVDVLFDYVETTLMEIPPHGIEDRTFQFMTLKSKLPKYLLLDDRTLYNVLRHPKPSEMNALVKRILIYVMDRGILENAYTNPLGIDNKNVTIRIINIAHDTNEISISIEALKTIDDVNRELYGICSSIAPNLNKEQLMVAYSIVKNMLRHNLKFNQEETKRRIEETVNAVKPVMGMLKKGQTLVREGDTVTTETLNNIKILNTYTATSRLNYIIGVFLLQLSFMIIFGFFLLEYHTRLIPNDKTPIIIFSLVVVFLFYTFFLSRAENILNSKIIFSLYLPIAAATMIISSLFNIFIALVVGLYLVFFTFLISGATFPVIIAAFSSAFLGVFVLTDVERRTDFLRGGLILGIINSIVVIGVCLMEEYSVYDVLRNVELSLANGIINSILVLGIFPVYENVFGITTKFHLLELSDLNAPIFKRMLIKAPGTYNHSLMVSTMSENACKDIGANYLLARVGAYYHDIGKIENAGIYIENKVTDTLTKTLSPVEYSKMIVSHVEKGVELAKKNKLPEQIIDFIREHHGKTIMAYFYHQALEEADSNGGGTAVDKRDFQYPGPKPQSRETAVVMLADSVEAASRSLQEPTSVKLETLVKKIIFNKLNDEELQYSDLTMSDLNKIQKAFMRVLNGIFHSRIEYPEKDEVAILEKRIMSKEDES